MRQRRFNCSFAAFHHLTSRMLENGWRENEHKKRNWNELKTKKMGWKLFPFSTQTAFPRRPKASSFWGLKRGIFLLLPSINQLQNNCRRIFSGDFLQFSSFVEKKISPIFVLSCRKTEKEEEEKHVDKSLCPGLLLPLFVRVQTSLALRKKSCEQTFLINLWKKDLLLRVGRRWRRRRRLFCRRRRRRGLCKKGRFYTSAHQ